MTKLNKNLLIFFILFMSSLLSIVCNSWFAIWIFMELNMLTFIAFLLINNGKSIKDLAMKYFLINSFASSIFIIFNLMSTHLPSSLGVMCVNLSLMIKLGIAPFHMWYVNMMKNLNWTTVLIMSSSQKIIPLILLYHFNSNIIIIPVILSGFISVCMGLMQVSLKKIFAYSSVNHMSWVIFSIYVDNSLWIKYFIFYSFMLTNIIMILNWLDIIYINDFHKMKNYYNFLIYLILSLMGLPPLYGFSMKWMFIQILLDISSHFMTTFLIISSLIYSYYYLRITLIFLFMIYSSLKFYFKEMKIKKYYMYLMIIMSIIFTFAIMFWILL